MSNKIYNILKWIAIAILPGLSAFIGTVGTATNWEHTGITVVVITALDTFLGTLIGVSGIKYANQQKEEQVNDAID